MFKVFAVESGKEVVFKSEYEESAKSIARYFNEEYGVTAFVVENEKVVFSVKSEEKEAA